jgi:hypothetical protein
LDSAEITPTPVNSDPENGRVASIFAGDAYTPFGEEWYKITVTSASSATVEPIGLGRFVENRSEIQGTVVASAGHNSWFNYFAVYNGTDTYLMKYGSWLNPGETNTKRWEFASHMHGAITKWEGRRAHSMLVSRILDVGTVGNPRLLVGMDNGTFEIITLPLYVPSPLGDSSCLFVTEGSFTLGIDDGGFGANDKSYHRAALLGANLSDAHGARVSYALDGDETFVDFEQDFTVNGGSVTFPESAQGKLIQPKITLFSDGDTETPQVNSLLLFAQVREFTDADGNPAFRRRRKLVLSTEDWTVNRQGLSDQLLNAQRLRDGIQQIAAAPSATIILSDGKSREISVLAWTEGLVIGPGGQERYGITLEYLESALASGADAGGPPDPGWGP